MNEALASPICVAELAKKVNISTRQLYRLFRAVFRKSPGDFIAICGSIVRPG
jgi:transcriptional regulator GlxA family with amidase domain